ncbi:MAG: PilW family protein [Planctomycetota bacterium]
MMEQTATSPTTPSPGLSTAGFTLVELMAGMVIATVLAIALGMVFMSSSEFFIYATQRDEVLERSRRAIDELEVELMTAHVLSVGTAMNGAPLMVYRLPVDIGEDANDNGLLDPGEDTNANGLLDMIDGDVIDPSGDIQWGCREVDGPHLDLPGSAHRINLTFNATGAVSETAQGVDINGDGDTADVYSRGSLIRSTSGGSVRALGGEYMILASPDVNGDRTGDGLPDPLYMVAGETFTDANGDGVYNPPEAFVDTNGNGEWDGFWRIHFTFYSLDSKRNSHLIQVIRQVSPRNTQQ